MGAYKDKNGTWYAQFRFTNWKGEPDRKTKRGFATKREALDWERDFLTQSSGNLEMTFEAFYELYKKNMKERIKLSTWNMKESVIEGKILPYFKRKRMCDIKPRDVVEWQNTGKAKTRTRDNDTSLRSWRRTRQRRDAYELGSNQAPVDFPRTWGVENK